MSLAARSWRWSGILRVVVVGLPVSSPRWLLWWGGKSLDAAVESYPALLVEINSLVLLMNPATTTYQRRRTMESPGCDGQGQEMFLFRLIKAAPPGGGARLGRLTTAGSSVQIDTPSFLAPSSRGVVPHLSHDNLREHTAIRGVYVALEDCTLIHPLARPLAHSLTGTAQLSSAGWRRRQCTRTRARCAPSRASRAVR